MKINNKRKVILHLLFPIVILILFFILLRVIPNPRDATDIKDTYNVLDEFKNLFLNYLYVASPHYLAIFLSLIIKRIRSAILHLMSVANIVLSGFIVYIVVLRYLHYVDLSLLWIFYLPTSLIMIFTAWLIVQKQIKIKPHKT